MAGYCAIAAFIVAKLPVDAKTKRNFLMVSPIIGPNVSFRSNLEIPRTVPIFATGLGVLGLPVHSPNPLGEQLAHRRRQFITVSFAREKMAVCVEGHRYGGVSQ